MIINPQFLTKQW